MLSIQVKEEGIALITALETDSAERYEVRMKAMEVVKKLWISCVSNILKCSQELAKEHADVIPFGSFSLKVNLVSSDIDAVCISSEFIERKDFEMKYFKLVDQHDQMHEVKLIHAKVPLISAKFYEDGEMIELDLLFARLPTANIPDDLMNIDLLPQMNRMSRESFNGYRMTETVKRIITNRQGFQEAMKFIKIWARNRGIDKSSGGLRNISWTIMMAFSMLMLYRQDVDDILEAFFEFSSWDFLQEIQVDSTDTINKHESIGWRTSAEDSSQIRILSSTLPVVNTSDGVDEQLRSRIQNEFKRGSEIILNIRRGMKTWKHLIQPLEPNSNLSE